MTTRGTSRLGHVNVAAVLAALAVLAACNKDPPPKPTTDEGKKSTIPVPTDVVFNDFLPQGGAGSGLAVRGDGGLEGGLGASGSVGAGAEAEAPPPGGEASKLKVIEPGAEPRAVRKYAFVANKSAKRLLTFRQGAGPGQENAFAITAEFVPKQVKPTGTHFEMKVLKLDLPDMPAQAKAQAAAQLAAFNGLTATFDVSPHGEIGEVEFKADERLASQGQIAQAIVQSLQQTMEIVIPPFPDAPIGIGAKWERSMERGERGPGGGQEKGKQTYELKELTPDGGVVVSTVLVQMPKKQIGGRGVPQGMTIEVNGKGGYTYNFRLDQVATKVDGELTIAQKAEVPGRPPESQTVRVKNQVEVAK